MPEDRGKLSGLFRFAQGVLAARDQVILSMRQTGLGCFLEAEITGLPGIELNPDQENWLVLRRLRESQPPLPEAMLAEWLDGRIDDPNKPPGFKPVIVREADIEEVSDLCEAEILDIEDVHVLSEDTPEGEAKAGNRDRVKIVLRIERLHETRAALELWRQGPWERWAEDERPVRKSIQLYNALFKLHNMLHGGVAATPPELVWGIGLARWQLPNGMIDMPLIEQLVDIEVQAQGALTIRPRDVRPCVVMKPFLHLDVEGSSETQRKVQALFETVTEGQDAELSPFDHARWENLLDLAAGRLQGRHITRENLGDGEVVKGPEKDLAVYSIWAIYGRARSENIREQDLERLRRPIDQANDDETLPASLRGYVAPAPEQPVDDGEDWGVTRTGLGGQSGQWEGTAQGSSPGGEHANAGNGGERKVYFFPLPYNEEQAKIIDRLETEDVVTVTGPPGTGKTHTIANIIGHFMAAGKRVLVTARTAEALAAVREKLPTEIKSLVIASVASDREGVEQLKDAIQRLSDDVVSLDVTETRAEIARLEEEILGIDEESRGCDQRLAEIGRQNLAPLSWAREKRTAMEMAEIIAALEPAHDWLADRPLDAPPPGLEDAIARLRIALPHIGEDLAYLGIALPNPVELPFAADLIEADRRERSHRARPTEDFSGEPPMARDTPDALASAATCHDLLRRLRDRLNDSDCWELSYSLARVHAALNGKSPPATDARVEAVWGLIRDRAPGCIAYEAKAQPLARLIDAAARGREGKRPVPAIDRIFNRDLLAAVQSVRVDGVEPEGKDHWAMVSDALKIEEARGQIDGYWSQEAAARRLPPLPAASHELLAVVKKARASLGSLKRALDQALQQAESLKRLFPFGIDIDACLAALDINRLLRALRANMTDMYTPPAALGKLEEIAARGHQPLFGAIRSLCKALGNEKTSEVSIVETRNAITEEIIRLRELNEDLERIGRDLVALREAGVPDWTQACEANPAEAQRLLPENWRESWDWAVMRGRLDRIIALGNGDDWREKKTELARRREQRFELLIRARTLLGLKRRLSGPVQTALATFTTAIRRLGKGTGKSAGRWRKAIRQAAMEAAPAAPVWVMPEHKIAEQLPAKLADFDLVILDEASQSDVTAVAALARGKKHLIVGDEQQVSPAPVGIPQNKINVLRAEHLSSLPNKDVIDEKTSIFEMGMQMYPKNHLMLREHFRCVEPIIQFSARFYNGRLIPIRMPKPSERFDPPLVDVFVKGAQRRGKTNEDEARFIVEEIAMIAREPAHADRDVAVISLIGSEQAELIERKLMEDPRVGTETMERMRIVCGDSRTMQGQERSIVFLSMVATPETARMQNTRETGQRFNVALSRARDRLYLVRSVSQEDLKPGDLKLAVLDHFADPMPEGHTYVGTSVLDRCQSGFEREVCERLIDANYRVRSQVKAGPFRIDLVVEGADDRRLAIELDGDAWHGPEKWDQDMARQAALERAGWTFWRVFGSQWLSDRAYWWNNLVERLEVMGIGPIGAEASDDVFTECRVFDVALGSKAHVTRQGEPPSARGESKADGSISDPSGSEPSDEGGPAPEAQGIPDGELEGETEDGAPLAVEVEAAAPEAAAVVPITVPKPNEPKTVAPSLDTQVPQPRTNADAARFYDEAYRDTLRSILWETVDGEGPIIAKYLCERVARLHGFHRTGSEIKRTILAALKRTRAQSHGEGEDAVIWPKDMVASEWAAFRGLDIGGYQRRWGEVPLPEKLGLARMITIQEPSEPESAMREALGMARPRTATRLEIKALLEKARADLESESP